MFGRMRKMTKTKATARPSIDTCGWDPGRDPWRALCLKGDGVEDGLSGCETVFACLDYDDNGSNFEDDTDTDFAGGRSRYNHSWVSITLVLE
jgi:hypothetical protein